MTGGPETCSAPGAEEIVSSVPAVEAYAEAVLFERSVDFAEGGSNPRSGGVAGNAAPAAVAVADYIRRVGQHKVGAPCGKLRQYSEAVAADDGVGNHGSECLMLKKLPKPEKPWEPVFFFFVCFFWRDYRLAGAAFWPF